MYRRFEEEAHDVLGSYDGRRITIARGSTASLEVAVHESIHERIFHETLDGILHRILIDLKDGEADECAGLRADKLMSETECAHEAAATFIGVQALDCLDERADTYDTLPPAYKAFYKIISAAINPLTPSTYLAYSLAWSVAFWAFQSERLFEVFREGWSSYESIVARVPSPTERLRVGIAFLESAGATWMAAGLAAAAEAYSASRALPWDVHDDDQWRAQPRSEIAKFEAQLSGALWRWLRDNAPIVSSSPEERPEGFDRWLLNRLDVPADQERLIVKDDAFDADPDNELIVAATAALRGGRACISNSDVQEIERLRTRESFDRRKVLARLARLSPATFFVGSATPTGGKGWAVYAYKGSARPGLGPQESTIVDRFLVIESFAIELLAQLQAVRFQEPHSGTLFMAPADAELLPHYLEKLQPLIGALPSGGAQVVQSGFEYPMWYWTGDWPDLLTRPGTATTAFRLEPSGTGIRESYILHLARMNDVPGYLFRLTAPLPGDAILRYEVALKAAGSLQPMPAHEAERILNCLSGHIGIILENWYVF